KDAAGAPAPGWSPAATGQRTRAAWFRDPAHPPPQPLPAPAPLSVETSRETRANRRPLGVEDGEVDRVALVAAHVHVLAQRALADGAEAGDSFLGASVAAVGLERDADAAEGLEAMFQEEVLRFRVGGRAPVVAGEKGRADLDLTVGRAHVEQTRGADRTARLAPHLGEHDRLAPGHQPLGLANQLERLVDRAGRGPGQVGADPLVLRRIEQAGRVTLGDRLERDVAPLERDGCEVQIAPWVRNRAIAGFLRPTRVRRTVSVCWPSSGGAVVTFPGVVCRRTGTPITVTRSAVGCGSDTVMPRAFRC